jgi:hypothetical protein
MMTRQLQTSALALSLGLPWLAPGQTAVPPQSPVPPAISSRMITIAPAGSYLGIGIQEITAGYSHRMPPRSWFGSTFSDSHARVELLVNGDVSGKNISRGAKFIHDELSPPSRSIRKDVKTTLHGMRLPSCSFHHLLQCRPA